MDKQAQLNQLFSKAKLQDKASSFSTTKELFVNSVGVKPPIVVELGKASFLTFKNGLIMMGITSILGIGLYLLFAQPTELIKDQESSKTTPENKADAPRKELAIALEEERKQVENKKREGQIEKLPFRKVNQMKVYSDGLAVQALKMPKKTLLTKKSGFDISNELKGDEYRFPVLTPDEIKENNKFKKKMLKNTYKKNGFTYIPSGTFTYEDKKVSVNSVFLQMTEVTNREYRTFLFDLLIQGKEAEFLVAKPDQDQWTQINNSFMEPMKDMYFSHPAYDNYPVVNVSMKGAEMYCAWLSISCAEAYPKVFMNDFRIPTKVEWQFAATSEGRNPIYPWGTDLLLNESGCFLANFNYRIADSVFWSKERLRIRNPKEDIGVVKTSDGAMHTAKVYSYNPNERGLYNVSGNVAELVYVGEEKAPGTCGGGWMNSASEVKLNAPDPYEGNVKANPNIGFRVITTYVPGNVKIIE